MAKVKICGITNAGDARNALLCGADYLGFIFHPPSPRGVDRETVKSIIRQLREDTVTGTLFVSENRPLLIGVFVHETDEVIAATLATCGLDLAQLSGDELPDLVTSPQSAIYGRAYQALQPKSAAEAQAMAPRYSAPTGPTIPTLLLDAYHPNLRGGTGETADWALAAELRQVTPRLMLAGGLSPDNVTEAIQRVKPFAVDVASGVEAQPGRKDLDKVRRFVQAAKVADQGTKRDEQP